MPDEPKKFRSYYKCPNDGTSWTDLWSCACNDKCPECNAEIEPFKYQELCLECGAVVDEATDGKCPQCGETIKNFDELQQELMNKPV